MITGAVIVNNAVHETSVITGAVIVNNAVHETSVITGAVNNALLRSPLSRTHVRAKNRAD